jgi:replication factor C subunit 2/4
MRQAVNNLQSTVSGFGLVTPEHVFKVCDQPHPAQITQILNACLKSDVEPALIKLEGIWAQGFSSIDIVSTMFRVVKGHEMPEMLKLEYIKEIGTAHMRLLEGCQSLLQLSGLVSRLCQTHL